MSYLRIISGLFLLLSGLLALLVWVDVATRESYFVYGIIGCLLSICPCIAGILLLLKNHWKIALIGSIVGLYTILTPMLISGILATLGFILLVLVRKEFDIENTG